MAKNLLGKSRKPGGGYAVLEADGWSWEILKLYKSVANSKKDPFARAFCRVKSPFVGPEGELGDEYLSVIARSVGARNLWAELEKAEARLAEAA